jgi:hypothetical protein
VSRLDFAPKLKEIQLTDIKKGLGEFTPKPDKPVFFAALKETLKKAGYTLDTAEVTAVGMLRREGNNWFLVVDPSGQRFVLEGANQEQVLAGAAPDTRAEITGDWKTSGEGTGAHEVITPTAVKKAEGTSKSEARAAGFKGNPSVMFVPASFDTSEANPFSGSLLSPGIPVQSVPLAPIRVTSPGLTVYKGAR